MTSGVAITFGPLWRQFKALGKNLGGKVVAVAKGTDVDQPRNLAKSVTVE